MKHHGKSDYENGYQLGLSYETPRWVGQMVWASENLGSPSTRPFYSVDFCRGYHNGRVVRAHATDLDLCQSTADVQNFADNLVACRTNWVHNKVRPYLVALLDIAQSKLRLPVKFYNGDGVFFFTMGSRYEELILNRAIIRRFPELVKLCEITTAVRDKLGMDVGDITPTIAPQHIVKGINND